MTWLALIAAGCFEVVGVTGITKVNQHPSFRSYSILIGGFVLSFLFLSFAMTGIGMSTAYAVWTGIGTVGSTLMGMFFYEEPKDKSRVIFIVLIVASVVGLKAVG